VEEVLESRGEGDDSGEVEEEIREGDNSGEVRDQTEWGAVRETDTRCVGDGHHGV
jgi:hypothetical protein